MVPVKPAAHSRATRAEQRRSKRFPIVVPVRVKWQGPGGAAMQEDAQARHVNAQGGLLEMKSYPEEISRVELTNLLSAETAPARVLALRRTREGAALGLAVELVTPSEGFWGVNFQLKKTNSELAKLEHALRLGGIDLRLLREFRDSVDCVCATAGAVQEWQECQMHGRPTDGLRALLAAERVRRATFLSSELATDVDQLEVNAETKGLAELHQAIERLYERLAPLFRREAQRELVRRK